MFQEQEQADICIPVHILVCSLILTNQVVHIMKISRTPRIPIPDCFPLRPIIEPNESVYYQAPIS